VQQQKPLLSVVFDMDFYTAANYTRFGLSFREIQMQLSLRKSPANG
jgi:hypothetical protein